LAEGGQTVKRRNGGARKAERENKHEETKISVSLVKSGWLLP